MKFFDFDSVPEFLVRADEEGREKMTERLDELGGFRRVCIGRSILSRPIECFFVGEGERRATFFGAHHALESITANILYLLIYTLVSGDEKPRFLSEGERDFILRSYTYCIIPCVNPDGIELRSGDVPDSPLKVRQMRMSGGDFSRWQANGRGVDLNHNYAEGFGQYKQVEAEQSITAGAGLYSGEYPESEPETRTAANFIRTVMPSLVVSLHSQGELIYPSPSNRPSILRIAERIARLTGYTVSRPEGTARYGGLCDYTGALGIPSFTLEVGRGTNPLPESDIPLIYERVIRALVLLPTFL